MCLRERGRGRGRYIYRERGRERERERQLKRETLSCDWREICRIMRSVLEEQIIDIRMVDPKEKLA